MASVSTNSSTKAFPQVSKDRVLANFKAPRQPIPSFQRLLDVFTDIFSKVPLEPENNLPPKEINLNDLFVEAVATPKPMRLVTQKRVYIPKSPFTSSNYIEDPTLRAWYYLDEASNIQGPFTSLEMDHWFDSDYFSHELLIRLKEKNDFVKLINLFGKTEVIQAYKSPFGGPEQSPYYYGGDSGDKKPTVYTFDDMGGFGQSPYGNVQKSHYSFDVDENLQDKVMSPSRLPTGNKAGMTPNQKSPATWATANLGQDERPVRNINESPQPSRFSFANSPARK